MDLQNRSLQRQSSTSVERPAYCINCNSVDYRTRINCRSENAQMSLGHVCNTRHIHYQSNSPTLQNIEIDWREVDPYFSELSDCASFWTLINFTCDVIYSGLFVLFFIMGQEVESMFFEGLLNHINPILIYLILSLIINYGALRSLRCGKEKCFLVLSGMKALLFPVTIYLLVYLIFFNVQDYFGTYWVSFVAIVSCYNGTAAIGLWSMLTCIKYIIINEITQKRKRKQAEEMHSNNCEASCRCVARSYSALPSVNYCESNQISTPQFRSRPSLSKSKHSRKIGDSCANNPAKTCKPDVILATAGCSRNLTINYFNINQVSSINKGECGTSSKLSNTWNNETSKFKNVSRSVNKIQDFDDDDEYEDVLSFEDDDEDDELLEVSTLHKAMQEIRLVDVKRSSRE